MFCTFREIRRQSSAFLGAIACALLSSHALARPVRIGHITSIALADRHRTLCSMGSCDALRSRRLGGLLPTNAPTLAWQSDAGGGVPPRAMPLSLDDGRFMMPTSRGLALYGTDGRVSWILPGEAMASTPARLPSEEIVAVTASGDLVVVTEEGAVRARRMQRQALIRSSPLVLRDGTIVARANDGILRAYDPTLTQLFESRIGFGGDPELVALPNGGFAADLGGRTAFFDERGVEQKQVPHSPVTGGFVGTTSGRLWASASDGRSLLVLDSERMDIVPLDATLRVNAGTLVGAPDGGMRVGAAALVVGINSSMHERFRTTVPGMVVNLAVDDRGATLAVVENSSGRASDSLLMICIEADGRIRWSVPIGRQLLSLPAISSDGTLGFVVSDRRVGGATEPIFKAWRATD